nr:hypothetical protein [uncultured Enterobacter sp.]
MIVTQRPRPGLLAPAKFIAHTYPKDVVVAGIVLYTARCKN